MAKSKKTPKKFLVLHGPNLNLLGTREPEIYGSLTLKELNQQIKKFAKDENVELVIKQSNFEGELIEALHHSRTWADGIVFNPGAFTHYSYALRDAVAGIGVPTVEVHLSDISKREPFRKISVIAEVCVAQIGGLGLQSYIEGLKELLKRGKK